MKSADIDICTMALLKDLAALDADAAMPKPEKQALLLSAIECTQLLSENGGGTLGLDKLSAIQLALQDAWKEASC